MAQDVAQTHTAGPQDSQTAALANIKAKLDSRNSNSSGTGRTQSAAADALRSLLDAYGKTGVEKAWRNKQLRALGNNKSHPFKSTLEQNVDAMHKTLAIMFNDEKVYKSLATSVKDNNHAEVSLLRGVCEVILQKSTKFQHLLARGSYDSTILHTIINPATYSQGSATDRRLSFDRLKPLIKFLLWLQPELPTVMGQNGTTLLFFVVKPEPAKTHEEDADETSETGSNAGDQDDLFLDGDTKTKIVQFICDQNPDGKGGDTDPVRSLALLHGASQSGDQASAARHAVHAAIESDFKMPDDIIARLKNIKVDFNADESREKVEKACLEVPDRRGRTCLHLALTAPFTRNKITWAKQLVKVQPSLLKLQYGHIRRGEYGAKGEPIVDYMTPLQYLLEQRKPTGMNRHKDKTKTDSSKEPDPLDEEMDDLRDFLKCQCLEYFDYITCKAIMYTRQNGKLADTGQFPGTINKILLLEREIFLTLSDETISSEFLKDQRRHYKLDKLLQSVHIASNNRVQWSNNETWDDDNETWDVSARNTARSWNCIGNTDLFMVFHWLKDIVGVKKVFVVVVDDLPRLESAAHSDMAIVECLKGLDVETWNWRRMDIPANVIIDAAGDHVKSLYLYCSGLRAVLQSWSDTKGLVNLKRVSIVGSK